MIGKEYYFDYKWTLVEFLQRGVEKFLDLEVAKSNYKSKPIDNRGSRRQNVSLSEKEKEQYR